MLPERLSNGVCSLKPHEDRLVLSVLVELDEDLKVK
ncbi:RNB domain-containing ribonuclease, partial [Klebsiella pneumoniae]